MCRIPSLLSGVFHFYFLCCSADTPHIALYCDSLSPSEYQCTQPIFEWRSLKWRHFSKVLAIIIYRFTIYKTTFVSGIVYLAVPLLFLLLRLLFFSLLLLLLLLPSLVFAFLSSPTLSSMPYPSLPSIHSSFPVPPPRLLCLVFCAPEGKTAFPIEEIIAGYGKHVIV